MDLTDFYEFWKQERFKLSEKAKMIVAMFHKTDDLKVYYLK
jgi:hypothetical protein